MWRQSSSLQENQDSDQSISEEEEDVAISLHQNPRARNNKDEFEQESMFTQFSRKVLTRNYDEEAISDDEECSVGKSFSSRYYRIGNYGSGNEESSTWSSVLKDTEELISLHDNAASSSSRAVNYGAKKISKGTRAKAKPKAKPKFSIHNVAHNGEPSLSLMKKDENENSSINFQDREGLEMLEHGVVEHSKAELLEGLQEEKEKDSKARMLGNIAAFDGRDTDHSISGLLEALQEKNESVKGASKMNFNSKGRKSQITRKRNICPLGERTLGNEDTGEQLESDTSSEEEAAKILLQDNTRNQIIKPKGRKYEINKTRYVYPLGDRDVINEEAVEALDSDRSSEDETINFLHAKNQITLANSEIKGKMMADLFQEAFNAAPVTDSGSLFATSKQTSMGLYGRLQQVVQTEKERLVEFMEQLQATAGHDETECMDVKILSRYLDAKLTVCQCSIGEYSKSSQCLGKPLNIMDYGAKRTIIFSSRVCSTVEIEVGSFVRVHPPWKEVKVMENDDTIILCTYFSQISI